MAKTNKKELSIRVKEGSWGALLSLLQELDKESLEVLKVTQDFRYHQARVNTLEEIIRLLPNTPE